METPIFLPEEDKEFAFEEYIRGLNSEYSLVIYRLDTDKKRVYLGKIHTFDLNSEDLHEVVKKRFGGGDFFIQTKIGGRLGKGLNISIETPQAGQAPANDALERKIDALISAIAGTHQKKQETEIEVLEKMKMYKDLFGGGSSNAGLMKEMIQAYKEGLETGKNISNPEPEEKADPWAGILQAVPMILQNMNRPAVIQQYPTPANPQKPAQNQTRQTAGNDEGEEMKIKYLALIQKIKNMAKNHNEPAALENKIYSVSLEIMDFFPELTQYLELVKSDEAIAELIKRYGIQISGAETEICKRIVSSVREMMTDDEPQEAGQ